MVLSDFYQQRLSSVSSRLKEIETTRSHLVVQLKKLDAESSALQCEQIAIRNGAAAISMLPNELLAAIFELGYYAQDTEHHFEMVVSQVIRHWRGVALKTPRLWTSIKCTSFQMTLEPVHAYLDRSMPLAVDTSVEWKLDIRRDVFVTWS